jgi:hypothetical protein
VCRDLQALLKPYRICRSSNPRNDGKIAVILNGVCGVKNLSSLDPNIPVNEFFSLQLAEHFSGRFAEEVP